LAGINYLLFLNAWGFLMTRTDSGAKARPSPQTLDAQGAATAHLLDCLQHSNHVQSPYDYWLLHDVFPAKMVRELALLPFAAPSNPVFNGRRESNNSTRVYFTPENQKRYPVCQTAVDMFSNPDVIKALELKTRTDLSKGHLRIEYCQDVDGFWLEPHLDISVKLFTMLVYLSDDPLLFDAGTDVYDDTPQHKLVASAPYEQNAGLIFIPGKNTWHGFSKRPIHGLRKSIIINYVSPEWLAKGELAYE
jgi:hypothetical protein